MNSPVPTSYLYTHIKVCVCPALCSTFETHTYRSLKLQQNIPNTWVDSCLRSFQTHQTNIQQSCVLIADAHKTLSLSVYLFAQTPINTFIYIYIHNLIRKVSSFTYINLSQNIFCDLNTFQYNFHNKAKPSVSILNLIN